MKARWEPFGRSSRTHTLPELLVAAGYSSFFATAIPTAEISMRGRLPSREISQHTTAERLTDRFLDWWDGQEGSRFGYVHFGDLHDPLSTPEREPFGTIPDIEGIDRWRFTDTVEPVDEFERYRRERIRLYDTNIREIDAQIERIYQHLAARGDLADTLVIVTGDHGEEFWEWAAWNVSGSTLLVEFTALDTVTRSSRRLPMSRSS